MKLTEKKIRLTENKGSYKCILPKEFIKHLDWTDEKELKCTLRGKRLIIEVTGC
ncbi:hypothetical protein N9924_00905 [bacterium]|nr:hypothetical protein [bacterium]